NPHHFSFNSPLGWCPTCEGLGVQKGANTALLIRDTRRSLREGALSAWPDLTQETPFLCFAEAVARHGGFDLDTPFEKLTAEQQRLLLHGSGDAWLQLASGGCEPPGATDRGRTRSTGAPSPRSPAPVRFQYKGLFPALDEASRVSFVYRQRLAHLVDEVACMTCHGSRLRDDAAAVRFLGRTPQELAQMPVGEALQLFKEQKLDKVQQQVAGELLREVV